MSCFWKVVGRGPQSKGQASWLGFTGRPAETDGTHRQVHTHPATHTGKQGTVIAVIVVGDSAAFVDVTYVNK